MGHVTLDATLRGTVDCGLAVEASFSVALTALLPLLLLLLRRLLRLLAVAVAVATGRSSCRDARACDDRVDGATSDTMLCVVEECCEKRKDGDFTTGMSSGRIGDGISGFNSFAAVDDSATRLHLLVSRCDDFGDDDAMSEPATNTEDRRRGGNEERTLSVTETESSARCTLLR